MEDEKDASSETSTEIAASWNSAQEDLLAAIADRANCCRWLHARCQIFFDKYNFWLTIPSIVIGTVSGSATIGLPGMTSDPDTSRILTIFMGVLTLSASVFTSVNQYMRTSQLAEGHRIAAVAYGKLHRMLSAELALRRDQRQNAGEFLKFVRAEQDRLQDTSPIILDSIIKKFNAEFKDRTDLEKPEVAGDLDHVGVNRSSKQGKPGVTPILDLDHKTFPHALAQVLPIESALGIRSPKDHGDANSATNVTNVKTRSADSILLNMINGVESN
jgi:hypothetical protein